MHNIRTKLQHIPLETLLAAAPWLLIGSGLITSLVVALFAVIGRLRYWLFAMNGATLLVIFGLVAFLLMRRMRRAPTIGEAHAMTLRAVLLSLYLGIVLLILPLSLSAWDSTDHELHWNRYGFMDKRFLLLFYWIAMATVSLFPFLANRLFSPHDDVRSDDQAPQTPFGWTKILFSLCVAILLAYYFTGPPWNLNQGDIVVSSHEFVHLTPLQAIHKGYLPYLGPASIQYGPGSQLFTYFYTHWTGNFSFIGIREASAVMLFACFILFCCAAVLALPFRSALLAIFLALGFSPFTFYSWQNGSLTGFWGWGNPARYIGGSLLILSLPWLYKSAAQKRISIRTLLAGFLWGFFGYMSPENLSTGMLGILFFSAVVWSSQTYELRSAVRILLSLLAGFFLFWFAPLSYYYFHGAIFQFLNNYFLIPRLVSTGYSNTPYLEHLFSGFGIAFLITPVVLAIAGLLLVFEVPQFRIRRKFTADQIRFLSVLTIVLVCYPFSLFRSAQSHFLNTTIGIPLFIAVVVMESFWMAGSSPRRKWFWRGLLLILLLAIYPHQWHSGIQKPLERFKSSGHGLAVAVHPRVGAERVALYQPTLKTPPVKELLGELTILKKSVGDSRVMIESFPGITYGIVYFLGDFRPAPYLLDPGTMMVNSHLQQISLLDMQSKIDQFDFIISVSLQSPFLKAFRQMNPHAPVELRHFQEEGYYIVGKQSGKR